MGSKEIRNKLSVQAKNGIGFLSSGTFIWGMITLIFLLPLSLQQKNMYMLISTGIMFPLAVGISTFIRADWKLEGNPFGQLGLILNIAQFIYFPLLIWAIFYSPENAVLFFAMITAAHFFPYGWFYNAKPYYIMSPIISIILLIVHTQIDRALVWIIPLLTCCLFILLTLLLFLDYRKKLNSLL